MEEVQLKVQVNSRFYTLGKLGPRTKYFWIVCHGYGQLAKFFIKKFSELDANDHFIVAPEGLNRFYLEGFSGRIGASWMTKEDRLNDIKNYCEQLNGIRDHFEKQMNKDCKIIHLGFSQGAATISRWMAREQKKCDHLILWGGRIAHEVNSESLRSRFKKGHIVFGSQDEFYSRDKVLLYLEKIKEEGFDFTTHSYEGGHSIDPIFISELSRDFKI
ncbi:MAG: phospholipase [Bacteroidota bacterium]